MIHKSNNTLFSALGLTNEDQTIYEELLGKSPQTISQISRATNLHRPFLYRHIPKLVEAGIVRAVSGKKITKFLAENPQHLEALFDGRRDALTQQISNWADRFAVDIKKPIVTYKEGPQGIRDTFADLVETMPKEGLYYRYSAKNTLSRSKGNLYLPKNYQQLRDAKKLERFIITNDIAKRNERKELTKEIKAVPADFDLFEDNVSMTIYGHKVVIVDYNSETAITIESPTLARFQEKLFKLLFRKL